MAVLDKNGLTYFWSKIKALLNAKQPTITGGASTITGSNLTTNRALISDDNGKVAVSPVTNTELSYLDGVTSNVQTQLAGKANSSHTHKHSQITDLSSWKTTNFGSGTINVGNYDFIEVPVKTYILTGETLAVDYTVTKRHGMILLLAENDNQYVTRAAPIGTTKVKLINNYNSTIYFVMIAYKTGLHTSSLSKGESKIIDVGESPATFPVLIFW